MKNSIKSKISHLFKGKPSKLDKYPTYDPPHRIENEDVKSIQSEQGKIHNNKKSHKKPKTNLTLNILENKIKNISDFPVLPSPMTDPNESSKLTAQEFAKAVGIKILHRTDEEEDEDCDCEYCRAYRNNANTVTTMDSNYIDDNATPTQPIPNVTLNQFSLNVSIPSSNNTTISSGSNNNINIPPFPAFNFSNEKLPKCSSNTSLNTTSTNNSNHSLINSKTIGTPGYYCHRSRKNSISKVVDMSLFIPPTEQELKSRVHSSSLSISSTPESSSIQAVPSNEKIMGGSLDRNKNISQKKNYYGICISPNRDRSASTSFASSSRPRILSNSDYKTSPILKESSIGHSSRIQFKQIHRCDSGTELSNANAYINPSSPNKRPYPPSLASSSSSTTLSSALSLTHISQQPNLNTINSSQTSSQSVRGQDNTTFFNNIISRPTTPNNSSKSPKSSCSSITPIKPHSSFKITRSVTISEGGRHAEINIQPLEKEEVKVYQKGRFTITCEHSRRPSINSSQD